jgi:hypothetical protein
MVQTKAVDPATAAERGTTANEGRPLTSAEWCDYFQANNRRVVTIPWEAGVEFTAAERAAVARSIQIFQLGETGQGRHITRAAAEYARRTGDVLYPRALQLFIEEEHRHAALLGRVLDASGIPRIGQQWSAGVFRKLRHLAGLEAAICVLLTAELIAMIYYAALRRATASKVLRRVCDQILRDEVMHLRFQCERLAILRQGRPRWVRRLASGVQSLLFLGTCAVFYFAHRRVLRAGGFSVRRFARRARHEFLHAAKMMRLAQTCPSWRSPAQQLGPV